MKKKILIINPFGIGDVIFSTTLVETLKKEFPENEIGYICNRRASELMSANPFVKKVFVYEKDDYRKAWKKSKIKCLKKILLFLTSVKKWKPDISIDLSLGYQYSMFAVLIGIKKRAGFNYRKRGIFLTDAVEVDAFQGRHVIEYYLDALRSFNISREKYIRTPKIYVSEETLKSVEDKLQNNGINEKDLLIGMIPGCGASWGNDAKYRRWDKDKFALLVDKLIEKYNAKVILLGNIKEKVICDSIVDVAKGKVINLCGATNIKELMGIIAKCRIIITNDGGPLHIAVGLGVKSVSIFGPVGEVVYGPYPDNKQHIVISRKNLECRPCYKKFRYVKCNNRLCLDLIKVEEVLEASGSLINK